MKQHPCDSCPLGKRKERHLIQIKCLQQIRILSTCMLRFNKNLTTIAFRFGGSADPSLPRVKDTSDPDMRDKLHTQDLTDYQKTFLAEHSTVYRPFSLYGVMGKLPNSMARTIGNLVADNKTVLRSDNLYLPRLTPNGVPIYDSLKAGAYVLHFQNLAKIAPFLFLATTHFPGPMIISGLIFYFGIYRQTFGALHRSMVIKMELVPETEEVLIQKVQPFGTISTDRVKIADLEHVSKAEIEKTLFYRFSRSQVDSHMAFRVKTSGELLTFDLEGYWYEEGLNHELMI